MKNATIKTPDQKDKAFQAANKLLKEDITRHKLAEEKLEQAYKKFKERSALPAQV